MKNPSIETYLKRRQSGRPYFLLFLLTLVTFASIIFRVLASSEARLRFLVINEGTVLLAQETPFREAGEFHVGQAERATLAMLSRGPRGATQERELHRLFDGPSLRQIKARHEEETPEFLAKEMRQVVEIFETKIQKASGRMVEALVTGQLIRYGNFEGRVTAETHTVEVWMRLVHNPSLVEGGRYPLIVGDFEITTQLVPAR